VIGLQLFFLLGTVSFHSSQIAKGTKILLETTPVDPFSVFRGRYVALRYKISQVHTDLIRDAGGKMPQRYSTVYVALEKKSSFWEPVAAYLHKPKGGGTYLRGKIDYLDAREMDIQYGIESFFLNEKSADEIEKGTWRGSRDWRKVQEATKRRIAQLPEEDQRIFRANLTKSWANSLNKEIDEWLREEILPNESAIKIREKYSRALERIAAAQNVPEEQETNIPPLTVEVSVAGDGRGYPVKLFWDGKEYH